MNLSSAILSTLAYHDIFDYPLDFSDVYNLLIQKKASVALVKRELIRLREQKRVGEVSGYHFFKNRKKIARIRKLRAKYSQAKFRRAAFFAGLIRIIPSVKLVAISGALSMKNSRKGDDIDLVIITSKSLLWTTRLLANVLLLPFKRDPAGQKISDRACLNMFLDESGLSIKDHNIYTAHEICQMKLLWDRGGTYQKFINANRWVGKYLPNWQPSPEILDHRLEKKRLPTTNYLLSTVENLLKDFQLWYMKKKLTTERISVTQLFFHPRDTRDWVVSEYGSRLRKLGIASS